MNFSFAPPVDEQLQSPETLRQQSQDLSSLLASFNNEEPIAGKSDMAATYQNDSQSLPTLGEADVSPRMDISSSGEPPTVTVTHWSEEFTRCGEYYRLCNCCECPKSLSTCTQTRKYLKKRGISLEETRYWEDIRFLLLQTSESKKRTDDTPIKTLPAEVMHQVLRSETQSPSLLVKEQDFAS